MDYKRHPVINGKYKITGRIGSGSFGEIFMGIGISGERVALKIEKVATKHPQLRHEYKVYRHLFNAYGFATPHLYVTHGEDNILVMDLLGPSLECLFEKCKRKFSLKTVLQLADQMIERIQTLHQRGVIHRDIKPHNFVIGLGDRKDCVYCIDFGLSKRFMDVQKQKHCGFSSHKSLTGTPRYASINNHLGFSCSRRDDLESLAYALIYFLRGNLPWQRLEAKTREDKYKLILQKKQVTTTQDLCENCPPEFAFFLESIKCVEYEAEPNYTHYRKMFRDLYVREGFHTVAGPRWDWDGLAGQRSLGNTMSLEPAADDGRHKYAYASTAELVGAGMVCQTSSSAGRHGGGHTCSNSEMLAFARDVVAAGQVMASKTRSGASLRVAETSTAAAAAAAPASAAATTPRGSRSAKQKKSASTTVSSAVPGQAQAALSGPSQAAVPRHSQAALSGPSQVGVSAMRSESSRECHRRAKAAAVPVDEAESWAVCPAEFDDEDIDYGERLFDLEKVSGKKRNVDVAFSLQLSSKSHPTVAAHVGDDGMKDDSAVEIPPIAVPERKSRKVSKSHPTVAAYVGDDGMKDDSAVEIPPIAVPMGKSKKVSKSASRRK